MSARTSYRLPRSSVTLGLVLFLLLLGGCGSETQDEAPPLVEGNFAGEATPTEHALVAISAEGAREGEDERKVWVYLCDGGEVSESFYGLVSGNELDFTSIKGARLHGTLTPEAANGTITLDDGTTLLFTANPNTGADGLYEVNISDDGKFGGNSKTGGHMEGQIAEQANLGDWHAVDVTVTPPGGEPIGYRLAASGRVAGIARLIVSGTEIVGAGRRYGDVPVFVPVDGNR